MIARLTVLYVAIFAIVLLALSAGAYAFVAQQYHALLLPALGTPEGASVFASQVHRIALDLLFIDLPLLLFVAAASYALARVSLAPFFAMQERERRFVADAAHELRSPLSTIASLAQAAEHDAGPTVLAALARIARTAIDAGAVVGDLLTLARNPNVRLLEREPLDLAAVVHACMADFSQRAHLMHIDLSIEAESAIVDGDERHLRELLRNLLENAIRHTRGRIGVRSGNDGSMAFLSVSDDGPGTPAGLRSRIFERFVRADSNGEGSGLGLAIARWVAQSHGGTLVLLGGDGVAHTTFLARFPRLAR